MSTTRLLDLFWDTLRRSRAAAANAPLSAFVREQVWTHAEFERALIPPPAEPISPAPRCFDRYARETLCVFGLSLPIPGDADAPEMRDRVASAAGSVADLPHALFLETCLRAAKGEEGGPWRAPHPPRWKVDGRPLFAEGRLQRPQGNLLGGSGLTCAGASFLTDLRRVRQLLPGQLLLVVPPSVDGAALTRSLTHEWAQREEERKRAELEDLLGASSQPIPPTFAWQANALGDSQDWLCVKVGSGDPSAPRPLTVHVEEPRVWVDDGAHDCKHVPDDPACGRPRVLVATRACVEVVDPSLCMKVEKRG